MVQGAGGGRARTSAPWPYTEEQWQTMSVEARRSLERVRCQCGRPCEAFACCPVYVFADGTRVVRGSHEHHARDLRRVT